MRMKKLSAMIQDGSFVDYKIAVMTAELHGDKKFRYREEIINTRDAKLEVTFVETFMDSLKDLNDNNTSRTDKFD
jgi:hypothetical protein